MRVLDLTITVQGRTDSDLEQAVEEALRRIRGGCTSGMDRNDGGSFHFEMTGAVE